MVHKMNGLKKTCFYFMLLISPALLFGQNTLSVIPGNATPGKRSLYSLAFTLPDSLPSDGAMSVVFPAGFDLSGVKIAASNAIKGGFTTRVEGNEIILVRNGLGETLKSGQKVDLKLAVVRNAKTAAGPFTLQVLMQHEQGKTLLAKIRANNYALDPNLKKIEGSFTLRSSNP